MKKIKTDVTIHNVGCVLLFCGLSKKAITWTADHVSLESWQRIGKSSFVVETRDANDIRFGMEQYGLVVK